MANLYGQYVWLIDTIRSAGRITKAEIDRRWAKSSLNEKHEATYPLRSFHRHKEAIREVFGLIIGCDLSGGYVYYISNFDDLASDGYRSHLLKSLEFSNQLLDNTTDIRRRILFEPLNDGSEHLAAIFAAMRDKLALQITYRSEFGKDPMEVVPYCLKEKNFIWYLAAKKLHGSGLVETEVVKLPELESVIISATKASMPRHFNGEIFFNSYFGQIEKSNAPKLRAPKEDKPAKTKSEKTTKSDKIKQNSAPVIEQLSLF